MTAGRVGSRSRMQAASQPDLELDAQAQLDIAACVVLARHASERALVVRIGVGRAQVWMIEEIEDLGAELHGARTAGAEALEERQVPLLLRRPVDQIAGRVAERPGRGRREG